LGKEQGGVLEAPGDAGIVATSHGADWRACVLLPRYRLEGHLATPPALPEAAC
jgi:hypothetical protein